MAGERCLQRDLRRLLVADLADEHYVRVLPQDRAQRGGERQPRLRVHLNLDDVLAQPVLHRIFDGDDVDPLALDHPDGRIERGGLPGAGGAGDEEDPLLGREQTADRVLLVPVHAECVEAQHGRALAQDTDDDLLAQRGRQSRDAEVHRLAVHRHAGAAVLRPEPVGDVEPRHDLDAGDERQARVPRNLHHLPEHAVDAVAHHDAALDRLDVDVARPAGDTVGQHDVHQADDRPLARLLGAGGRLLLVVERPHLEVAADSLEQAVHDVVVPVHVVDPRPDRRRRAEQHPDFAPGDEGQHLLGIDVERVGGRDFQVGVGLPHGHHVEPPRHLLGDALVQLGVEAAEVGDGEAEAGGDRLQHLVVDDQLALDQDLPERGGCGRRLLPDPRHRAIGQQGLDGMDQPFIRELHRSGSGCGEIRQVGGVVAVEEDKTPTTAPTSPDSRRP